MALPIPGQRWVSTSEPSLGLGIVIEAASGQVKIHFPAAEETRLYALASAPLVRALFKSGDRVADRTGAEFFIDSVRDHNGLATYFDGAREVPETELSDSLSFSSPDSRLLAGFCEDSRVAQFRRRALKWNSALHASPARGFTGARADLLPHQIAIAREAARRVHPRLLLADEVGLGKTIEAGLILHRLHLIGRADRILILVPEALIHQWFVELLRRFNLTFTLLDSAPSGTDPFSGSQLFLAPISLFAGHVKLTSQAANSGFDLLIVDEAHHLEWSPKGESPAYRAVAALAAAIPSVLLLTATPRQLGAAGHFAQLRMLDPHRYSDFHAYLAEAEKYPAMVAKIETLLATGKPADAEAARRLIDLFGTGRSLFRNTRRHLGNFPERMPALHPLAPGESRSSWLAKLLRELPEEEKILLITDTPADASLVREELLEEIQVETALFTDDMSLLERDRQAAWFADPEGARILIASEIGSEGRNFQFAHHLVLFHLPTDPNLLEQRIGRLDRIGQEKTVIIHVPYETGTRDELVARWYQEGLDAFTRPLRGADTLGAEFAPILEKMSGKRKATPAAVEKLLGQSRARVAAIAAELDSGHDRLLELGAPPGSGAASLIDVITAHDSDPSFERFILRLFDHLGLEISDLSPHTYKLARGQRMSEAFGNLPEDGLTATFLRPAALALENTVFLTIDHPMVLDALEYFLASDHGKAAFARWSHGGSKAILLEAAHILETVAPPRLNLSRYLPPTALLTTVDHRGEEFSQHVNHAALLPGDAGKLVLQPAFREKIFPLMLDRSLALAKQRSAAAIKLARDRAKDYYRQEIERLRDLSTSNPAVSPAEISALEDLARETDAALSETRLRLDSLLLIWCTPE